METSPASPLPPLVESRGRAFLAAALTAVLVVLAFPPCSLDLLGWVAFVPLFAAARGAGGRRGFLLGYAAGALLEAGGFYWICYAILAFSDLRGAFAAAAVGLFLIWLLYAAIVWGVLGWLLGRCRTPAGALVAAVIWAGFEDFFPRLFPWHVGGVVHDRAWMRQGADLFGASGLSLAVLLVNAVLLLAIEWRRRGGRPPIRSGIAAAAAVAFLLVYGAVRLRSLERALEAAPRVRVALVQTFLDPVEKGEHFLEVVSRTAALVEREHPDLVLLPEGIDPYVFDARGPDPLAGHRIPGDAAGRSILDGIRAPLVLGGGTRGRRRFRNSAAYVLPSGEAAGASRVRLYHKNRLLLFGERVPLEGWMPAWLRERVMVGTLEAGTDSPAMPLHTAAGTFDFRILICYEAVLPDFVRQVAGGVDFLVNITEDLWYGRTSHTAQHVSVLRMRAVESRIPLVRCTNAGPSGVVEATGEFTDRTEPFRPAEKVVTLRPGRFFSLYRAGGHWFSAASLAAGIAIAAWRRRRRGPAA